MNGVLIIDKPCGLTSHDVVNRVRRILQQRSIGHLGTLDPMATGVLPLVTGNLTRLAQFYTTSEKIYEGTIRFGFATDTYDADGQPTTPTQEVTLLPDAIEAAAARFRGVIEQTPPPFSAKKIHGVPAYKLARQQKEVVLKPVQVEIKELAILAVEIDRVRFRARVASGTYMRSVAHEMGQLLTCGAHLESLRRTAVAEFTLEDAHTIEALAAAAGNCNVARAPTPASPPNRRADQLGGNSPAESTDKGRLVPSSGNEESEAKSPGGTADNSPPILLAGEPESRKPRPVGTFENSSPVPLAGKPESREPRPAGTLENSPPVPLAGKPESREPRPVGTPKTLEDFFVHPRKLLPDFPSVTADELTAARIRSGRTVNLPQLSRARQVKVFQGQRDLIAIATRVAGTLFHAKLVLSG